MSSLPYVQQAELRRQEALAQFDYFQSFEQLDSEYQNGYVTTVELNKIMIAKFKCAALAYGQWSKRCSDSRGIKGKLFERKKWRDVQGVDRRVMGALGRPEWMQTAWAAVAGPLDLYSDASIYCRTQDEIKETYNAYAAQMRILDQQIVQPIDHALQTNANDIAGGRDSLVRVALGIHRSILTALELVYVQFRRCWTPLVLPRPFCKLAESIQGNRNFAFTPVQVRPPPKYDSPNEGRWYRCPECEGVVKAFWSEEKGYDMAATFAGHLVAKMQGEEVPLACMNCQKEFENAQRLGSHVFEAEWESRRCWAPPEKLKPPINYSSLSDYA